MQRFNYVARDNDGREQRGTVDAKDRGQALAVLRQNNLSPQSVTAVANPAIQHKAKGGLGSLEIKIRKPKFLRGRVKQKDLMVLTRQLATLVESGLPLVRGLRILQKQAKNDDMKEVLTGIGAAVESGSNFSEALARYPRYFDNLYVNMTKAGEAGGQLEQSLTRLAEFLEKSEKIKNKVKSAMTYPIVVMFVAIGITTFLMIKVIPQFEKVFKDLMGDKQMPGMTRFVMGFSKVIISDGPILLVGIVLLVIVVKLVYKTKNGKMAIDKLKLKIPGMGNLLVKSAVGRTTRTLGTLMQSGVPVLQALDIVRDTSGNAVIDKAYQEIHESVKEGDSMTPPMERAKVFPPMVVSMVDVGEETGALPDMLARVADTYDDEVDNAVEGMTSIIEPILIVFLAIIVGTIVIAMFQPMMTMIGGMSGA